MKRQEKEKEKKLLQMRQPRPRSNNSLGWRVQLYCPFGCNLGLLLKTQLVTKCHFLPLSVNLAIICWPNLTSSSCCRQQMSDIHSHHSGLLFIVLHYPLYIPSFVCITVTWGSPIMIIAQGRRQTNPPTERPTRNSIFLPTMFQCPS